MQAPTVTRNKIHAEAVESLKFPGDWAVEIIHTDDEGKISFIHFVSHQSKRLAEEYADWKNQQG